ncbi:MAG: SUF system NifU family Fe-S cluster assembly protein [Woeseiaceae bacterium]|jgi:nitrogen fixation NifU-like protein|nr:SUF system NifU family Fe-S cluster assembly protein [Woeseiaceae bacterium]
MNRNQNTAELQDLYRELILDHARKPSNFKRLNEATHSAEGINPLCGDKLHLYLHVNSEKIITDIGFEGSGCAISIASASLLTETICNLSIEDAKSYFSFITNRFTQQNNETPIPKNIDLSKLQALDGVNQYPTRIKCATLPWHTLNTAIIQAKLIATTE